MGRGASSTSQAVATRPRSRSSALAPVDTAAELTPGIADVSSLSSRGRALTADPFAAVFGAQRGEGDTRLDTAQPTEAARTRMARTLDHARAGNLDPACVFLNEHRRSVDAPMVAELLTSLADAACVHEFNARQEWLADFMHSTVRDGRNGRILRALKKSHTRDEPGVFELHLRPDAEVDDAATQIDKSCARVIAACGSTGEDTLTNGFERTDVGLWNDDCDARYTYHRCQKCMSAAPQVLETSAANAGVLPASDIALLHHAHREAATAKIRGGLHRRAGFFSSERLASYAQKSFPSAAVAAGTQYALSGGDGRLKQYCPSSWRAERVAHDHGYTGPLIDLLDAEFFTSALQLRMPQSTAWSRDTWEPRRRRFDKAVGFELLRRVRAQSCV